MIDAADATAVCPRPRHSSFPSSFVPLGTPDRVASQFVANEPTTIPAEQSHP